MTTMLALLNKWIEQTANAPMAINLACEPYVSESAMLQVESYVVHQFETYVWLRDFSPAIVDGDGKIAKRLESFLYKNHSIKLSNDQRNHIGNLCNRGTIRGHDYIFDIVPVMDWNSGDYCENPQSCWWGSYKESRYIIGESERGAAIRFYADSTVDPMVANDHRYCRYTPVREIGNLYAIGRAVLYLGNHDSQDVTFLFNAYGKHGTKDIALLVSHLLSLPNVERRDLYWSYGYVNSNACHALSRGPIANGNMLIHDRWSGIEPDYAIEEQIEPICDCDWCGDAIYDHDNHYYLDNRHVSICSSCMRNCAVICDCCHEYDHVDEMTLVRTRDRYIGANGIVMPSLHIQACGSCIESGDAWQCYFCGEYAAHDISMRYIDRYGDVAHSCLSCAQDSLEHCDICYQYRERSLVDYDPDSGAHYCNDNFDCRDRAANYSIWDQPSLPTDGQMELAYW
jgi:hypothetical protein